MLDKSSLIAFAATQNPEQAKHFYGEVLGLQLVTDEQWAMVFNANGTTLWLQKVEQVSPTPYTALGWRVDDIRATIRGLTEQDVVFERYEFLPQDEDGVWSVPGGAQVAWFKDPDGNLLSLTQF